MLVGISYFRKVPLKFIFGEEEGYISQIPQVGCEISNPPEKTYFNIHTHSVHERSTLPPR